MGFLRNLLKTLSGSTDMKVSEQLLFDKIIGFRGIVPGVGTSTIVQNVAIALSAQTNYSICVLDTHFLYPTLYPMLMDGVDTKRKDFLDFQGDLSEIVLQTAHRNVSLLTLNGRTIVDMMSSKDSELIVNKLIGALKSYFDIILVDLSYEPTNLYAHTAIKCNRIINVADHSLKCVYNLRKSLNTMATLAVPFAKANKVVVNKVIPDILTNINGVLQEAGLKIIGEIPYSMAVAKLGVAGKRVWANSTSNKDIFAFSSVINAIVEDIIDTTPLNEHYLKKEPDKEYETEDMDVKVLEHDALTGQHQAIEVESDSNQSQDEGTQIKETQADPDEEPVIEMHQPDIEDKKTPESEMEEAEIEVPIMEEGTSKVEVVTEEPQQSSGVVEDDIEEEVVRYDDKK